MKAILSSKRHLHDTLISDLRKKFVFLAGPRQVGKTTLAKNMMKQLGGRYFLYDDDEDRRLILTKQYAHEKWVCLDEFHKFSRWKAHLKGVYDKYHENLHLLLTGSARLDVFQKSGDSLLGRYYLHHLHPLTCGELITRKNKTLPLKMLEDPLEVQEACQFVEELFRFGGFPEPFLRQSEEEHRRWSNMRRQLLIQEDLRELTQVQLISLIEQLMILLPERIGSLFSYHSLSEDIRVSVPTIQSWMEIFKRLYIVFHITPYSRKILRSLQKQPKYYFYDWSQILDEGPRFENMIASHLWKSVQVWTDLGLADLSLHYIRDRMGREVDFLVTRNQKPWFLVESKLAETQISESLRYFSQSLNVPGIQVVLKENIYKRQGNLLVISASQWLPAFE